MVVELEDRKYVLKNSLLAMKKSLLSSYDMRTNVIEERFLLEAWGAHHPDYVVFSDYRRNDGWRRIRDVAEIIDRCLRELDTCDYRTASKLYLDTLNSVALHTKHAHLLEKLILGELEEKKE